MSAKTNGSPPAQRHTADNLSDQLGVIIVQMGRIMRTQVSNQDRAEIIVEHARKKMLDATDSFHSTLDDLEIEIMRAKAVFLRDLDQLRGQKQQNAAATTQVAPPAPMVIDLDGLKPSGPTIPVAPMMASGSSAFVANHGIPKAEGKPVAPFPDMGAPVIPPSKPADAVPFARAKTSVDQKHPSPKQTKQPTPKPAHKPAPRSNPPSGRMANKPNPMASTQNQVPRPSATAPPSAPAMAPAPPPVPTAPMPVPTAQMSVAPAAPMAPVNATQAPPPAASNVSATTQIPFTNATFTLDPTNHDAMMPSGGGDTNLDMPMIDMDTFGTGGSGSQGDAGNNDTTMDDLDHFFDLGVDNSNNNNDSTDFNNIDDYMNGNFDFDGFE